MKITQGLPQPQALHSRQLNQDQALSRNTKDDEKVEFLRQGLLRAFDEGNESPYDLREGIVENILRDMDLEAKKKRSQPDQGIADLLCSYIDQKLPIRIKHILKQSEKIWLCGGSIIRVLIQSKAAKSPIGDPWTLLDTSQSGWLNSDWDFFCGEDELKKESRAFAEYEVTPYPAGKNYIDSSLRRNIKRVYSAFGQNGKYKNGRPINIIISDFNSISDILCGFDLQCIQIGFSYKAGHPKLQVASAEVLTDILLGLIRLNPEINFNKLSSRQKDKTMGRVRKYIGRGFRDLTGLEEQGLLSQLSNRLCDNLCLTTST